MPIPNDTYYVSVDHDWLTGAALALALALALAAPTPDVVTVADFTGAWTSCARCGLSFTRPKTRGRLRTLCYDCSPRGHAPLPAVDYSLAVELSRTRAALEYVKRQLRMGRPKLEILSVIEAV